jgi:hypothetical protein
MDSVHSLLKQEINTTVGAEHDLAKWKLGVTAALGAAAFGLTKDGPSHWLLLLVPFVCAYVDLYAYQYQLRIRVIARFLREHPAKGDELLQAYELECEKWRGKGVFSLGNWAGFGCSLGASAIGPVFYVVHRRQYTGLYNLLVSHAGAGMVWLVGVLLILILWLYFRCLAGVISGKDDSSQTTAAAEEPSGRPHGSESPASGTTHIL